MKVRLLSVAVVTALAVAGCGSGGDSGSGGKVTLKFQSLAYQTTTVAATKKIVDSWNSSHPDIQVQLVQGSWDSVHDQLVTQFQGGKAPDIIHDEAADIADFTRQGYLADLSPYLSSATTSSISPDVWKTVSSGGKVYAGPTLLQSYLVFANTDALARAGITVPAGDTLSWDDFQAMAKKATNGAQHGVGWGLKSPTATVMSLGLNYGAKYFTGSGSSTKVKTGDAENEVPQRIHDMIFKDRSVDPATVSQSGTDILPGFYAGRYAMVVEGSYAAQQITQAAPKSFHWAALPVLSGTSAKQAADPQTLSVSAQSKHVKQAARFVDYFLGAQNLAAVARGDWLIPTSTAARDVVAKATGGANGWTQTLASGEQLTEAPFQTVAQYPQWKDQIATPALQQYLADKISLGALDTKLTDGWKQVSGS
jgi:ABC-type glycerol-3-phosphate transport system substrate-binding protein